jgi:hypothetical protein
MRWIGAAVIGVVLLIGVGGVALAHLRSGTASVVTGNAKPSTCADAYRVLALRPSQIAAAKPVCLVESLKFSGELTGTAAEGYPVSADDPSPTSMCAVPKRWDGFPEARLAIVVGAKAYRLRILAPGASQHHPETFNNLAGVVELRAIKDPSSDWNQATGSITLNADGISGTVDANLLRDFAGAQAVHVTGKWACGAPLPLAAFDASVPCGRFYALNQIHDEDMSRMKASACQAEDLTFGGAIQAHLDHALTDTAVPFGVAFGFDNVCGLGGYQGEDYAAALKFSIGDESFLLNIGVRAQFSAVGPGQYSIGRDYDVDLFWGRADPENQGRFETDLKVYWFSSGGTFTIAPDMKSGTIDATLTGSIAPAGSDVQLKGNWRCAA